MGGTTEQEPRARAGSDGAITGRPAPRRGLAVLVALMLAAFTFNTAENLPIGLLGLISESLGVSLSAVGLLVTGYGVMVAVFAADPRHAGRAPTTCAHGTAGRARRVQPGGGAGHLLLAAPCVAAADRARPGAVLGRDGAGHGGPVRTRSPWACGRGAVHRRFARPRARCSRRNLARPQERLAGAHRRAGGFGARLSGDDRRPAADLASGRRARRPTEPAPTSAGSGSSWRPGPCPRLRRSPDTPTS